MKAKPGEIWLADLGLAAKVRPVLVVSRYDPDAPRALTIYVPLTTQHRGSPYEVPVGSLKFLDQTSFVNVQGVRGGDRTPSGTETRSVAGRHLCQGQRGIAFRV